MTGDAPDPETFAARVARGMYELDHAARGWGIDIVEVRSGHARMTMMVRDDMINSHGICHGAMIFALADTAFAYACNAENRSNVAMTCTIAFLSPGRPGETLTAVADERTRMGRNGVFDITVSGEDGRVVAEFRGNSREIAGESVPGLGEQTAG